MKAEDLMIGDLVRVTNGIAKVHDIGKIVGVEFIDGGYDVFKIEELEPIPLTPEILEKNGFRIIFESELHVSYFQDIESFHVEIKVDKVGIFQKLSMWDGFGNKVTIIECRFVHQLQHALRLCGINHELIL